MIIVRFAQQDDIPSIAKFNSAMALETEDVFLDNSIVRSGVEAVLNNAELGFYLIAECDGKQIGQLLITKEWSDWRNKYFWWIQSVYVQPEFRKQNVYRKLYQKVIEISKNAGNVCGIRLYVDRQNTTAQKVYAKLSMQKSNYLLFEVELTSVKTV